MNPNRIYAGWACLGLGFALIVLLGTGVLEPPGLRGARSMGALLASFLPFLLAALALFGLGLWLIRRPKRR